MTPDLHSLSNSTAYQGGDYLQVENGKCLPILHTDFTSIHTPQTSLNLNNVLHVAYITKPLLSVQKFTHDNNVFFKFHLSYFLVKDRHTKNTILQGPSKDGLYLLSHSTSTSPSVHSVERITSDCWHHCLGHLNSRTLHQVLRINKLSSSSRHRIRSVLHVN